LAPDTQHCDILPALGWTAINDTIAENVADERPVMTRKQRTTTEGTARTESAKDHRAGELREDDLGQVTGGLTNTNSPSKAGSSAGTPETTA
jgi:hypothetical protein